MVEWKYKTQKEEVEAYLSHNAELPKDYWLKKWKAAMCMNTPQEKDGEERCITPDGLIAGSNKNCTACRYW